MALIRLNRVLFAACLAAASAGALHRSAHAIDERRGSPGNASASIESCVSHDWIHFGSEDQSAVLDDADHRMVRAEMIRRYPVIESDGFPSSRTILWRRRTGELLYIAVIDNPTNAREACFTATFAAERFDLTPGLRKRYLPPALPGS